MDNVIRSGYFHKQRKHLKTWKVRYFILTSTHLSYAKRSDKPIKGSFALDTFDLVEEGCPVTHAPKHFVFGLVLHPSSSRSSSITMYLSLPTLTDRQAWLREIKQAQNNNIRSERACPHLKHSKNTIPKKHSLLRRKARARGVLRKAERKIDAAYMRKHRRDGSLESTWLCEILPDFKLTSPHGSIRLDARLTWLCYAGLPRHLRGRVWATLLGNHLQINQELFAICLQKAQAVKFEMQLRKDGGQHQPGLAELFEFSAEMISPSERNINLVILDMPRTFAHHAFFQPQALGYERLRQVLEAYTCYRPDLGYVQGMSYLAATLCFHLDAFSAFKAMCGLMSDRLLFDMYRLAGQRTLYYVEVFDELIETEIPTLGQHFQHLGLDGKMYMVEWSLTLFTRVLPLETAYRIWDIFVLLGSSCFFQLSLGILMWYEPTLLEMDLEQVMHFLHHLPPQMDIDDVFHCMQRVQISRAEISQMLDQRTQTCWSPVENHTVPIEFPDTYE